MTNETMPDEIYVWRGMSSARLHVADPEAVITAEIKYLRADKVEKLQAYVKELEQMRFNGPPVLPCDMRVYKGTFGKGVEISMVENAIDRHLKYRDEETAKLRTRLEAAEGLRVALENAISHHEFCEGWECDYHPTQAKQALAAYQKSKGDV